MRGPRGTSLGRTVTALLACALLGVTAACSASSGVVEPTSAGAEPSSSATSSSSSAPSSSSALPVGWVDEEISFRTDDLTFHGTFRHPSDASTAVPGALLIAGSGPTDRNGDSPLVPGSTGTLLNLAGALASDGVASLRYDKLGSGTTGLGPFVAHPDSIGVDDFTHEAQAALRFLAKQPGVDRGRLSVYGHSEGALFALLLATDAADPAAPVHSLGLLEPLTRRYLDLITEQVVTQADQQLKSGKINQEQYDQVTQLVHQAVTQLRTQGTVPANMPYGLDKLFTPSSLKFLREADKIDPATLGAKLPATMPVLITCSDADIQVSCADVEHLAGAIHPSNLDFVHLTGVDHILKQDDSRTAANYGKDLPFSTQLSTALQSFSTR